MIFFFFLGKKWNSLIKKKIKIEGVVESKVMIPLSYIFKIKKKILKSYTLPSFILLKLYIMWMLP